MKAGKVLCLFGGLISLIATFLFAWFVVDEGGNQYYGHGLGVLFSLPETIGNAAAIASSWGADVPTFAIYIVAVVLIIFILSWILMLIGIKSRASAIIGGIIPIGFALAMLFGTLGTPPNIMDYVSLFDTQAWGIFPFNFVIGPASSTLGGGTVTVSLGTYLLIGGGALSFIGGFLPRK